jgi:phosphoenolpyruvate synthase/pyruvate phosphate dikinase
MLGFRGASRYAHPAYAAGFALECKALVRVRKEMGLINLKIMVPFCRRVAEAEQVIAAMAQHGLKRGENGLESTSCARSPTMSFRSTPSRSSSTAFRSAPTTSRN